MSEIRRRRFDKEFKLEAVRLVVEEGRPVAEVFERPWYTWNILFVLTVTFLVGFENNA